MDWQKPHDIGTKRLYSVKVSSNTIKGSLFTVITHENRIHDLVSVEFRSADSHRKTSLALDCRRGNTRNKLLLEDDIEDYDWNDCDACCSE